MHLVSNFEVKTLFQLTQIYNFSKFINHSPNKSELYALPIFP